MEVVEALGAQMLIVGQKAEDEGQGRAMIRELIASGKGLSKFKRIHQGKKIPRRPLSPSPRY